MNEEPNNNLKAIGATANLMMEAVDKASHDLETTVQLSADQLRVFNESLSKDFIQQLAKIAESALKDAEKGTDELQARKEDFTDRLVALEQIELETLIRTGKEVRNELNLSLRNAIATISQLVEEQVKTLHPMVVNEHENFSISTGTEIEAINQLTESNKVSLREKEIIFEKNLSQCIQEFDQSAKSTLQEDKEKLAEKVNLNVTQLEQRITQIKDQLSELSQNEQNELEQAREASRTLLSSAGVRVSNRLTDEVTTWQQSMIQMADDFQKLLTADRESFERIHKTKIEQQVEEIENDIKAIAIDGQGRISASHKLFQASLRRLEKKYQERLERLLIQFQAAIAQENQVLSTVNVLRTDSSQAGHELKELLNTRLKARGLELLKAFKRQVELFDLEYARFSASCSERIETARGSAKDSLEQHFKTMNTEIERTLRNFRVELSQLNLQLPQVKDAGHAAALAVMAYKRARLSFGGD